MNGAARPGWRTATVAVLVTLAGLALPLGVVAGWTGSWLGSPERFVTTLGGLRTEPEVQRVVADATADAVVAGLDVASLTTQWLDQLAGGPLVPPRTSEFLPSLSGPITAMVEDFVSDQVVSVLSSDRFGRLWDAATAELHRQVTSLLASDEAPHVVLADGMLRLRLGPFVAATRELLIERGFRLAQRIPDTDATVGLVAVDPAAVAAARAVHRALGLLVVLLPLAAAAALAGAGLLERDRRRLPTAFGLTLAGGSLLVLAAFAFARRFGLAGLAAGGFTADGGGAVLDVVFGQLQGWLWACAAVGLGLALLGLLLARQRPTRPVVAA